MLWGQKLAEDVQCSLSGCLMRTAGREAEKVEPLVRPRAQDPTSGALWSLQEHVWWWSLPCSSQGNGSGRGHLEPPGSWCAHYGVSLPSSAVDCAALLIAQLSQVLDSSSLGRACGQQQGTFQCSMDISCRYLGAGMGQAQRPQRSTSKGGLRLDLYSGGWVGRSSRPAWGRVG